MTLNSTFHGFLIVVLKNKCYQNTFFTGRQMVEKTIFSRNKNKRDTGISREDT